MDVIYSTFDQLNPKQINDAYKLRQQVFIIEQQCFYEDIDGMDDKAQHLFFYEDDILAAYLRVFEKGLKYPDEAAIGRIVVAPDYRGTEVGHNLIMKGIELCRPESIRIEAQAALKSYYQQLGFREGSSVYDVDGIAHLQMVLK